MHEDVNINAATINVLRKLCRKKNPVQGLGSGGRTKQKKKQRAGIHLKKPKQQ